MAIMACVAMSIGRRVSNRNTVRALTIPSLTRSRNTFVSAQKSFFNSRSRQPLAFMDTTSNSAACASGNTILRQSTVATDELEKTLEVTHPSFDVIEKDVVTEYGAYCTLYRHKKSGAELLSVANDDDNKVFGITFRTPPEDSTGVPHILEHSVLCGSRKYKTKDPFVQLLQGSLQTFLNAFTYPDRTCYVVASQNTKDFYNLINVYADAVYHPRATKDPMVHAQEGWHLELENKEDPLTYKGVVYNEMKGVYSSADSLLNRESQRSIFPDNTYGVDSGGDPVDIPDLSFEQFAEFHAKFYHPANSRIFFAGDDDVSTRLSLMDEYLSDFDASPDSKPGSEIKWQKKSFTEPKFERYPYPVGADQPETHMVMINWLLNDRPFTPTEDLTVTVLDHLMTGTASSVLRKALMESGLGAAITGGGLSDELLQATFSMGLKGVEPDNVKAVEKLIMDTFEKIAEEGFSEDDIASTMNTIEFQMREFNTGSFPKGLSFMLGSMSKWIYDESPTQALKFEEPLAELKATIAESGAEVFQQYIRDNLINNVHRSIVEMVPSRTLEEEQLEEEKNRLAAIKEKLTDEELDEIISKTSELKKLQASEDSVEERATIPSLEISDLKRESTEYPIEVTENENESGVTVVRHELVSTSGIAYVKFGVDISGLSLDDVSLLPILTRMMKDNGAGELSDIELSRKIGTHTGGAGVGLFTTTIRSETEEEGTVSDGNHMLTKLTLQGKATTDKIDELFSIFSLMLTKANLDSQKKVIEMLKESKSGLESGIQGSGHSFANTRMSSRYTPAGYIDEKMSGITYLNSVKIMLEEAEKDWPTFLARLEKMRDTILDNETCRNGMFLDITGEKAVMDGIQSNVESFLENLPGDAKGSALIDFHNEEHPWLTQAKTEMVKNAPIADEGFVVPTQVSYVGKGGKLFDVGEKVPASSAVVSKFLRTGYLWDNVRVIGGAYGGFCTFNSQSGFFSFLSYRDPNLADTIDVYDNAADALIEAADLFEKDPDALNTAIVGAMGDMDGALSPDQKGWTQFQRWITRQSPERRQKVRNEIIDTKASDFKMFGERLKALKQPSVAVVSSKRAFEEAAEAGKVIELTSVV
eukprot:CAMPEP_0197831322 /NCGR_PEP_ID=MMETSP1437-20131217/9214_1 /TAXON_ID=49252 ORGANISM="Eucampia antarctica, Strain CCMP1452" /NCGR_SAMPLE_ID=MMETSP1437 /ASSEMBLY_ACC=CAM_ASM_001096 /LENGTH=1100 /DNA_ID=CAMNT_0043434181 /DNA_START=53 /DNA_END=3355 /DNA_ORIENTATION=+